MRGGGRATSDVPQTAGERNDSRPLAVYAAPSSERAQLVTEPSYVITEVTNSAWETYLFGDPEPDQIEKSMDNRYSGESRASASIPVDDMIMAEDEGPAIGELDMFTSFSHEGLDANGDFSVGLSSPA